jgi:hypothetical protein
MVLTLRAKPEVGQFLPYISFKASNFANAHLKVTIFILACTMYILVTFIVVSAMSTKVAMDSLKFHPGPLCSTLLRLAGGPYPKRPYGRFWGGPLTKFYSIECRLRWPKWKRFFQLVSRFVKLEVKRGPYRLIFY